VLATQGPEGAFDLADMQLLLRWLDALARHPTGADDVTPVPGVLPPVQKLVLQILAHFNTVRASCATAVMPVCRCLTWCLFSALKRLQPVVALVVHCTTVLQVYPCAHAVMSLAQQRTCYRIACWCALQVVVPHLCLPPLLG
jgi:hypothetical protein